MGFDVPWGTNGYFRYAEDGDPLDAALWFSRLSAIPRGNLPSTHYGVYIQDDWRVGESLTLNLGLGYDVEVGTLSGIRYGEVGDLLINDPRSPYFGQRTPEDDKNNVARRLGFAWDVGKPREDGGSLHNGRPPGAFFPLR